MCFNGIRFLLLSYMKFESNCESNSAWNGVQFCIVKPLEFQLSVMIIKEIGIGIHPIAAIPTHQWTALRTAWEACNGRDGYQRCVVILVGIDAEASLIDALQSVVISVGQTVRELQCFEAQVEGILIITRTICVHNQLLSYYSTSPAYNAFY